MASPPTLDLDTLTAPIPGDAPAGTPEPEELGLQLRPLRKEIASQEWTQPDSDGGMRPLWMDIRRQAAAVLEGKSKHAEVAARLVEALTQTEGPAGLRDGLRLLHRLVSECWDRVHPLPEPGETSDPRAGAFHMLNSPGSVINFPQLIKKLPLVKAGEHSFSLLDWDPKTRKGEFEAAIPAAKADAVRQTYEDLVEARDVLKVLAAELDRKLGVDDAPDFLSEENDRNIGSAISRCIDLVDQIAHRRGISLTGSDADAAAADSPAAAASTSDGVVVAGVGAVTVGARRADLYRGLSQIATALKAIEPHSPIPYLLDRCVRLGELPFPELMKAIIRETATLDELDRLLGLEKPAE